MEFSAGFSLSISGVLVSGGVMVSQENILYCIRFFQAMKKNLMV